MSENNKVGEYTPSGYLDADGNVIELVGTDLLRDGIVYGMANAVQGDKFIEQTVLGNNQIVLKDEENGQDTVFDNAHYVKDYVEGTELNDGDIILSDKIWTGADYVKDFVAGTVLEEGQIVFNDYIYNAIDKGNFIEGTVLEAGQIIWDNPDDAYGTAIYSGLVVDGTYQGTVLQPNEMVYNGKVWSDVQLIGDYQAKTTLTVGQIRWDNPNDAYGDAIYSGVVDKGNFIEGTVLGAGQMNYNGFVYEGYEIKGPFVPSTTLAAGEYRWENSPNGDAVYTGIVLVGNYVEGTPLHSNQVVYKGNIYNGAVMLSEYREGTPLSEGQIIMGPRGNANIYDGAVLVGENVDGLTQSELSLVNPDHYLYGNKIYDISEAVDTGVKYIAPIVPLNDDQIVINGFIYDMSDATDTGVKFVAGSVLGEYDKVHAGKIYNIKNLTYVKPYEKATEITANEKVIGGFIYD
ncbi:hypothetical protein IKJ53_00005, partial [bacterium]|nr:hypothetical protein [bacterium]